VHSLGWERTTTSAARLAEILKQVPARRALETARREVIEPLTKGRRPPAGPELSDSHPRRRQSGTEPAGVPRKQRQGLYFRR
jgi:hypothetical protein